MLKATILYATFFGAASLEAALLKTNVLQAALVEATIRKAILIIIGSNSKRINDNFKSLKL